MSPHAVYGATIGVVIQASSGAHFGWPGIIGVALLVVGGAALFLVDVPRRAFRRLSRKDQTRLKDLGADNPDSADSEGQEPGPQPI